MPETRRLPEGLVRSGVRVAQFGYCHECEGVIWSSCSPVPWGFPQVRHMHKGGTGHEVIPCQMAVA
jgi:hypothetical protein